jgi:O-antigen ligase
MFNKAAEQSMSWFLSIGVAFTTVFLVTDAVSDPVNVTKLAAAGGMGFSVFAISILLLRKELFSSSKPLIFSSLCFILASILSICSSASPVSQNIYGSFGRNTGFVFYLVMIASMLGASTLRDPNSFSRLLNALLFAGILNVIYCAWVIAFGDFIGWTNPYRALLGLFGNPNFISSFLGMFISALVAYLVAPKTKLALRITGFLVSLLAFYEIITSRSIQGIAVTIIGIGLVGFFRIRSATTKNGLSYLYIVATLGVIFLGVAGALQKGPLASIIYKSSISLRGRYWDAGLRAGLEHPLTGVGMDSYGDWFRRARSEYAAMNMPGTISNAAHNVVLDIFSYGGFPLLLSYLAMLTIGVISIFKVTKRTRVYNGTFVGLTAAWVCYEVQSVISINQAGLAIWGWVLLGALVAFEYATRSDKQELVKPRSIDSKKIKKSTGSVFSPQLIGGLGALAGIIIAVPPMSADMRWKSALKSQSLQNLESALNPGYMQPANSAKYAQAVQLLEQSKFPDLAYTYAKRAVEFNPDSFDSWKLLYFISKSTQEDKSNALKNLKRLDPMNPDVLN